MVTRREIIDRYSISEYLQKIGQSEGRRVGQERTFCCPFHGDSSPSLRVNERKRVWFCDPCGTGGTIIDMVSKHEGLTIKQTFELLSDVS